MTVGVCRSAVRCARRANYYDLKRGSGSAPSQPRRWHHTSDRTRCSEFWTPLIRHSATKQSQRVGEEQDSNNLLVRAGFFRQAYSGLFHLLPLGLRVQNKIQRLLEKHMQTLQASQISLSSISSQDLWSRSGRMDSGVDVFKFHDRKSAKWILSPTHEEEITQLIGNQVQSHRDLPIRLYQISRKYRDEPRPRQGLLRGREFLMKDLYTFDVDVSASLRTYEEVRQAYARFFDELKMPYIVAEADSGNMGGELSHEYHLPSSKGEDTIISCSACTYVKNEELVENIPLEKQSLSLADLGDSEAMARVVRTNEATFLTQDKKMLVKAYCRSRDGDSWSDGSDHTINPYTVKAAVHDVALGIENPAQSFYMTRGQGASVLYIFDDQLEWSEMQAKLVAQERIGQHDGLPVYVGKDASGSPGIPGLVRSRSGDRCPACSQGRLRVQKAIEIGHTFHLGSRYSEILDAKVAVDPASMSRDKTFVQMGCHGVGISRLIAAAAACLYDTKGLNWPRVMAPFEVVIIAHRPEDTHACDAVYDSIVRDERACDDAIIDDRQSLDWLRKLRDADLIGYPVIIFLGAAWRQRGEYEVQCRRLKVKQNVAGAQLADYVKGLLAQL